MAKYEKNYTRFLSAHSYGLFVAGGGIRGALQLNPPGSLYHMMVIKGHDAENFIVHDVGTRHGENFVYPYDVLMNAMHEWHDTDINLGAKKVIAVQK